LACICADCSKSKLTRPWLRASDTDERNAIARRAFEAVLTVTLRKPDSAEYRRFSDDVKARAMRDYNETFSGDEEVILRPDQGGYIFYAGGSLAGAGYCRQCRRWPTILPLQLWQGCQVCVKISVQRLPRVAQFNAC